MLKLQLLLGIFFTFVTHSLRGFTDPGDVAAINSLYVSLGSPVLPGWVSSGGDPCGEAWHGVQCNNSNILSIANLGGDLGNNLEVLASIVAIDLSNNHIGGSVPSSLPITIKNFFLSASQFTGSIPSSLSSLTQLTDLSLKNNLLSGDLPDSFQSLTGLINLDLSNNDLSGTLPPSMRNLSSLTTLHEQDNQFYRTLDVLEELPLRDLNLKSVNLLLDDDVGVHVSDCGVASLISSGSVSQLSGHLLSEYGYGSPEFESGVYTIRSDVYSFEVVMLVLLTGRKSYDGTRNRGEQFLVRWAIPQLHDIDALSKMVDPSMKGQYPNKSLSRFADIVSRCFQSEPESRPTMSEVVQDLLDMIRREASP